MVKRYNAVYGDLLRRHQHWMEIVSDGEQQLFYLKIIPIIKIIIKFASFTLKPFQNLLLFQVKRFFYPQNLILNHIFQYNNSFDNNYFYIS